MKAKENYQVIYITMWNNQIKHDSFQMNRDVYTALNLKGLEIQQRLCNEPEGLSKGIVK